MRVTMMLADHAQVADGKLFLSGGGRAVGRRGPAAWRGGGPMWSHFPWQHTTEKIASRLKLLDEDGSAVSQPGPGGAQEVRAGGQFEAGRARGLGPGRHGNVTR